jgi:hypothetical protein
VRDMIDPFTGEVWSEAKKRRFIQHNLEVEGEFVINPSAPKNHNRSPKTTLGHFSLLWYEHFFFTRDLSF